jgi:hypothetical protein
LPTLDLLTGTFYELKERLDLPTVVIPQSYSRTISKIPGYTRKQHPFCKDVSLVIEQADKYSPHF